MDNENTLRVALDVIDGPHRGARFEFDRHATFLVGRGSRSHLCLRDDLHFSRHHLRIEVCPPQCLLVDLGSRNGTFVNEMPVTEALLQNGDVISGGKTRIQVTITGNGGQTTSATEATVLVSREDAPIRVSAGEAVPGRKRLALQPLPGYELLESLGEGSMGVVYRAEQKATGRQVAVKLIIPRQTAAGNATQLFIREASVMARLDHPHIVRCFEFGFAAGQFFLVMERVPTVSLESVLKGRSAAASIRIPCAITCKVLNALEYAHRLSVVHRDIKPDNVLLTRSGQKLDAKLADFGLAKNFENAGFSELTREGDIRGTMAYMPPEQVVDCRYARPAADIYSVGATLYRFLTGEYPIDFGSRNKLAAILEDEPVPIRDRRKDVPEGLSAIVHRALAKDPGERYQSAEEFERALRLFAGHQGGTQTRS